jgi:hypothetical protein
MGKTYLVSINNTSEIIDPMTAPVAIPFRLIWSMAQTPVKRWQIAPMAMKPAAKTRKGK